MRTYKSKQAFLIALSKRPDLAKHVQYTGSEKLSAVEVEMALSGKYFERLGSFEVEDASIVGVPSSRILSVRDCFRTTLVGRVVESLLDDSSSNNKEIYTQCKSLNVKSFELLESSEIRTIVVFPPNCFGVDSTVVKIPDVIAVGGNLPSVGIKCKSQTVGGTASDKLFRVSATSHLLPLKMSLVVDGGEHFRSGALKFCNQAMLNNDPESFGVVQYSKTTIQDIVNGQL